MTNKQNYNYLNNNYYIGLLCEIDSTTVYMQFTVGDINHHNITVDKYVLIDNYIHPILGRISEVKDKKNSELDVNKVAQEILYFAKIELLGFYSIETKESEESLTFNQGLESKPLVGSKVYEVHDSWLQAINSYEGKAHLFLGHCIDLKNQPFMLPAKKLLAKHCAVFGTTGSGKSWTIARIIEQTMQNTTNAKQILFDVTGEWASVKGDGIERLENNDINFLYVDIELSDLIFLLLPSDKTQRPVIVSILEKAENEKSLLFKFFETNVNKEKLSDFNAPFINRVKNLAKNKDIINYFDFSENKMSIISKIKDFLASDKKLLIINIQEVTSYENIRALIFNIITRNVLKLARDAKIASVSKQKPLVLIVDEAHQFFDKYTYKDGQKLDLDDFNQIAKEGRKYGLVTILSTQQPRDLPSAIVSQMGSIIMHRVINEDDKKTLRSSIGNIDNKIVEKLPLLQTGMAILAGINVNIPTTLKIEPPSENMEPKSHDAEFENNKGEN